MKAVGQRGTSLRMQHSTCRSQGSLGWDVHCQGVQNALLPRLNDNNFFPNILFSRNLCSHNTDSTSFTKDNQVLWKCFTWKQWVLSFLKCFFLPPLFPFPISTTSPHTLQKKKSWGIFCYCSSYKETNHIFMLKYVFPSQINLFHQFTYHVFFISS